MQEFDSYVPLKMTSLTHELRCPFKNTRSAQPVEFMTEKQSAAAAFSCSGVTVGVTIVPVAGSSGWGFPTATPTTAWSCTNISAIGVFSSLLLILSCKAHRGNEEILKLKTGWFEIGGRGFVQRPVPLISKRLVSKLLYQFW